MRTLARGCPDTCTSLKASQQQKASIPQVCYQNCNNWPREILIIHHTINKRVADIYLSNNNYKCQYCGTKSQCCNWGKKGSKADCPIHNTIWTIKSANDTNKQKANGMVDIFSTTIGKLDKVQMHILREINMKVVKRSGKQDSWLGLTPKSMWALKTTQWDVQTWIHSYNCQKSMIRSDLNFVRPSGSIAYQHWGHSLHHSEYHRHVKCSI